MTALHRKVALHTTAPNWPGVAVTASNMTDAGAILGCSPRLQPTLHVDTVTHAPKSTTTMVAAKLQAGSHHHRHHLLQGTLKRH